MKMLSLISLLIFVPPVQDASSTRQSSTPQPSKTQLDMTGIQWAESFRVAMDRAKSEQRIVMVKMIAGGSDRSGCW